MPPDPAYRHKAPRAARREGCHDKGSQRTAGMIRAVTGAVRKHREPCDRLVRHTGARWRGESSAIPARRWTSALAGRAPGGVSRCTSSAGRCVSEAGADACVEPGHNSPWTKPSLSAELATAAAGLQVVIIDLDPAVCRNGGAGRRAWGHRQARSRPAPAVGAISGLPYLANRSFSASARSPCTVVSFSIVSSLSCR